MARLKDVPLVLRRVGIFAFLKRLLHRVGRDNIFTWSAALAYSWLFALFPFLIFLLTLVPFLPADRKEYAREELREFIHHNLAQEAATSVWNSLEPRLDQILNSPPRGLLGIGLFVALWAASGGVAMTIAAMNKCYDVEKPRGFIKHRLVAMSLTIVLVSLILMILVLIPIGTVVTNLTVNWLAGHDGGTFSTPLLAVWQIARYSLALVLMFAALHFIYHYGPNLRQRMTLVTPGAVFCVVAWIVLGVGFRFYVDHFGRYSEMYGAVGGVAILLLLFYIDATVLLIGGEINSEIDYEMIKIPGEHADLEEVPASHAGDVSPPDAPASSDPPAPLPPMSKFNPPPT